MARIEVPMPQMGESIAEGTVSKWLKKVGESVQRDEPILEISTDKVDAEIPSPSEGTVVEILVEEGQTVEVGTVVAYLESEPAAAVAPPPGPPASATDSGEPAASSTAAAETGRGQADASKEDAGGSLPERAGETVAAPATALRKPAEVSPGTTEGLGAPARAGTTGSAPSRGAGRSEEERLRTRSTPVVRRIAEEHGVDLAQVPGTGHAGRVTKQDILGYLETKEAGAETAASSRAPSVPSETPTAAGAEAPQARAAPVAPVASKAQIAAKEPPSAPGPGEAGPPPPREQPSDLWSSFYSHVEHPEFPVRPLDRVETMDKIRRLTAEHMVLAKRIAPHVHSFIEIDFTEIDRIRRANKARWSEQGVNVSYTAFVVWACSRLLREYPKVNGTISGNNVVYRGNVNVGVAVDLDPGLIVPVIRDADELSLVGIAKRIVDLAERARSRRLNPEEIQGATFSITNPGVLGTLAGTPIVPKGTSAILGTGVIEKRVAVVEDPLTGTDAMAIRKRSLFSLGYDHRIVDGADAARFMAGLKDLIESFPEDA